MKSRNKFCAILLVILCMLAAFATGCGAKNQSSQNKQTELGSESSEETRQGEASEPQLSDGSYQVQVSMEGGSGKASIESPATLVVSQGQKMLTVVWSSKNYDYMIVDGQKYLNEAQSTDDPSTFTFPITSLVEPLEVVGDTLAMSQPHEITYQLTFTLVESYE